MAKNSNNLPDVFSQKRWAGGISDYLKEGANGQIADQYYFGVAVDYRTDPQSITLLPGAIKESGLVVTDLLKWGDVVPTSLVTYYYGDSGNIYSRSTSGSWTNLRTVSGSHGNGLAYYTGDDYLYYTTDTAIGRYGTIASSPQFTDNFLQAQGGVPLNIASLSLASASSMYATAADSATLSQTGNLTLETFFKATTLPAVGSSMVLLGKWDESANTRSYKLDLFGVSGYFGDGSDGSLTISVNTTEVPIDAACTGTSGTQALAATNVSFAQGQVIFIHQSQGANAGQWERNTIQGYTAGSITLNTPLIGTYVSGAQVRVVKQYTNVTINTGITWTIKAWNGTTGGILAFLANGTLTVTGVISASGSAGTTVTSGTGAGGTGGGFRGGISKTNGNNTDQAFQGEGTTGLGSQGTGANGTAGGGGGRAGNSSNQNAGGGGGHATAGGTGATSGSGGIGGTGGSAASDTTDLTTMVFGSGGGGGMKDSGGNNNSSGGSSGGGIVFPTATVVTVTGSINANGGDEGSAFAPGGGGGGGSVLIRAQVATLGSNLITATGGVGSQSNSGGTGRVHLDYLTSYIGTTAPTLDVNQDNTLVTTTTIQARLGISNNGTSFEYLTQNLTTLTTGVWNRLSVAWTAASAMATFYLNAVPLGTSTGTKTSISDNVSLLYVGADKTSAVADFFNGLQNDMRIWGNVQSASQIAANNLSQLTGNEAGLKAYYKFNSAYTDGSGNSNTLTPHNSPTFSTDVPFSAPTTRLDIDQSNTAGGSTYALSTSISEVSTDRLTFTPEDDPQKSVDFKITTKGSGNWTVTVHDAQNNTVATQTIASANLPSGGYVEFIYTNPWRIVIGKTYHMHLTSTVADGSVESSISNDFATGSFHTYFQFLVTDTQFHPIIPFLNFLAIGNERYIAKWDGAFYTPNLIAFPPGWKVRCFGFWREMLAVGMWKGGNISDIDRGRIYFWDGISLTFNFFIDVPEGQINAMIGIDTDLYFFAGYRGQLLDYQGASAYQNGGGMANKVKFLPLRERSDNVDIYPGALSMWRGLIHMGIAGNSTSTTIMRGVYSFGTLNQYYPPTLSYDYIPSTGNTGNTVTIGLVYPIGETLIVGWQDGIAFGADMVSFDNPCATSGSIQTLAMDDNTIWHESADFQVRGDYLPLASGQSIDVGIQLNRAGYTNSTPDVVIDSNFTKLQVSTGRASEYQLNANLYSTSGISPTLLGLSLLKNELDSEGQF